MKLQRFLEAMTHAHSELTGPYRIFFERRGSADTVSLISGEAR